MSSALPWGKKFGNEPKKYKKFRVAAMIDRPFIHSFRSARRHAMNMRVEPRHVPLPIPIPTWTRQRQQMPPNPKSCTYNSQTSESRSQPCNCSVLINFHTLSTSQPKTATSGMSSSSFKRRGSIGFHGVGINGRLDMHLISTPYSPTGQSSKLLDCNSGCFRKRTFPILSAFFQTPLQ